MSGAIGPVRLRVLATKKLPVVLVLSWTPAFAAMKHGAQHASALAVERPAATKAPPGEGAQHASPQAVERPAATKAPPGEGAKHASALAVERPAATKAPPGEGAKHASALAVERPARAATARERHAGRVRGQNTPLPRAGEAGGDKGAAG